ncbi:MAG: bleomycin resistance protein [Flavobacteriales bacterium]
MLNAIHPKLPMRNKAATRTFYIDGLGFEPTGPVDYDGYLMLRKDNIEIHFFEFRELDPLQNYGQVYIRTAEIEKLYQQALDKGLNMPAAGQLQTKPWGQKEFSLLDPDHNLLTFGQSL